MDNAAAKAGIAFEIIEKDKPFDANDYLVMHIKATGGACFNLKHHHWVNFGLSFFVCHFVSVP
ncbi:hypothetical protein GH808_07175 [Acetobacterium fimetarium]|uniref:Uncharacterized protein n=1 Tax=Acetobacterium fimetarium TaxID=52691 RepID=A0ABR6WUF2_9FIRM|nr:hypothetical protein [Acetobacterium fimetarium]MBC3804216.1 hypothetical protein [Acetobacterium fimetarium]